MKKSKITAQDWAAAYQRIESITGSFPLMLLRIEAYSGYQPELDKEHFDLRLNAGTPDEHLSFYADWMSYTAGTNLEFYKNWDKQAEHLYGEESDEGKPITWCPPQKFADDGSQPGANGMAVGDFGYIDTRGALYRYVVLAIGTMLENLLPGRALLTVWRPDSNDIEKTTEWLEGHFGEDFDLPIYFDKQKMLASFINEYKNKKDAVGRLEHLYRKQFKRNIEFAITNIGYGPAFHFYAEVLTIYSFGTFGFSDVLDPWIAVTKDLESALELIAESKRILLEDKNNERSQEKARAYDLTRILKELLNGFILWTPQQREQLDHFYTNKEALETGHESLFGSILRMSGRRADICPIYADRDELFEAFMYHDPKSGTIFKNIIDEWVEKNAGAYDNLKQKLYEAEKQTIEKKPPEPNEENIKPLADINSFVQQYPEHEQFFVSKALEANPYYIGIDDALEDLRTGLWDMSQAEEHQEYVGWIKAEPKEEKIKRIKRRLKELRMGLSICPDFEQWIEDEEDESVLFYIRLLLALKITSRDRAYARYRMLWGRTYWGDWRKGGRYGV